MLRFALLIALTLSAATATTAIAPPPAVAQDAIHRARLDAAKQAWEAYKTRLAAGQGDVDALYRWSLRWLNAEVAASPTNRARALINHKARMTELSNLISAMVRKGTASSADLKAAEYYRVESDLWSTYNATWPGE